MAEIDEYRPRTGRLLKEDGTTVNEADILDAQSLATSAEDLSDTTNATPNTVDIITFAAASKEIYMRNNDGANAILVSFDGGTTYLSLAAQAEINMSIARTSIKVKSTAASVSYSLLVAE